MEEFVYKNIFGARKPKYDIRDYKLTKSTEEQLKLPESFELDSLPDVKNQGIVNACVAHVTSSILEYHNKNANKLSTNFIYGIQNKECGYDGQGMYLSDACKIAYKYGDCLVEDCVGNDEVPISWEKAEAAFADAEKMKRASSFKLRQYFTCNSPEEIKRAIYNYGPVLGSIKWWEDFNLDKNNCLYRTNSRRDYGYHAIMIYGWNETGFLCQNSWGKFWGNGGRFVCPYNIPIVEAKGLVDDEAAEFKQVKRNTFLDFIYKGINYVVNFFKNLFAR